MRSVDALWHKETMRHCPRRGAFLFSDQPFILVFSGLTTTPRSLVTGHDQDPWSLVPKVQVPIFLRIFAGARCQCLLVVPRSPDGIVLFLFAPFLCSHSAASKCLMLVMPFCIPVVRVSRCPRWWMGHHRWGTVTARSRTSGVGAASSTTPAQTHFSTYEQLDQPRPTSARTTT